MAKKQQTSPIGHGLSVAQIKQLEGALAASQAVLQKGVTITPDGRLDEAELAYIRAEAMRGKTLSRNNLHILNDFLYQTAKQTDPTATPLTVSQVKGDIKSGDQGVGTTAAQMMLRELGYYHGNLDSSFGSGTRGAVEKFQRDFMPDSKPSGVIDEATKTAMNEQFLLHTKQKKALDDRKAELSAERFKLTDIELGGKKALDTALQALGKAPDEFVAQYNAAGYAGPKLYPQLSTENPGQILAAARLQLAEQFTKAREELAKPDLATDARGAQIKSMRSALVGLGMYSPAKDIKPDEMEPALKQKADGFDGLSTYAPKPDLKGFPSARGYDPARITASLGQLKDVELDGKVSFYSGSGGQDGGPKTASGIPFKASLPIVAVPPGRADLYLTVADMTVNGVTKQVLIADTGSFYLPKYDVKGEQRVIDASAGLAQAFGYKSAGLAEGSLRVNVEATMAWRKANGVPFEYEGQTNIKPDKGQAVVRGGGKDHLLPAR